MRKEQVLDLTERVRALTGIDVPIIVGSQALYGSTETVPDSVLRSAECDFLLLAVGAPAFKTVNQQIGFLSQFQKQVGYFADPLGLATVVLPTGWRERLLPLRDSGGNLQAYCLEVYDACVSKLMAGREKDYAFIKELLESGMVEIEPLANRAELVIVMPQSNALLPRLEGLETFLKKGRRERSHDLRPLRRLMERLKSA